MPEVSRFFGISIRFYYNDHDPSHFHAIYGEFEALIDIDTLSVLRGQLPRRALALVLEWASLHRSEFCGFEQSAIGRIATSHRSIRLSEEVMLPLVRILAVEPLAGFVVRLTLTNGEEVERNLSPLLNGPIFEPIRMDEARFRQVQALEGTLVWPGGADLCPDTVIWGGLPPSDSASHAA